MKLYISLFLVCFLTVCVSAQRKAPGYMGKRFVLKYDQGISWSLGGDARAMPNFFYGLQGDYAVTNRMSVGLDYTFMTRKYLETLFDAGGAYGMDGIVKLRRLSMHRIGIYTKIFSQANGHFAPAGPFFQVGAALFFVDGNYHVGPSYNFDKYKRVSFDFGPSFGGGKQYILGKGIMLNLDVRFTIPLISIARQINIGPIGTDNYDLTSEQRFNRKADAAILWSNAQANFMVLKLGFGGVL